MGIAAGDIINSRYRAESLLGRGGTGEVWRCIDLREQRPVALKAVSAGDLAPEDARRLLLAEVTAVARLSHEGIIALYDLLDGGDDSSLLVMQYHPGEPLDRILKQGMPSWPLVRDVLVDLLKALAHAHARAVLHLDLKPANVLVAGVGAKQRATLVDFGIARVMQPGRGAEHWFGADALVGTPEYMAPEQCRGEMARLGPWTDLYALGVMAFEMLTDTWPHAAPTLNEWLLKRISEPAPPLLPVVAGVPAAFTRLCATLLASDPAERPWCAADVLAELLAMESGSRPPLPSVPPAARLVPPAPAVPRIHQADTQIGQRAHAAAQLTTLPPGRRVPPPLGALAASAPTLVIQGDGTPTRVRAKASDAVAAEIPSKPTSNVYRNRHSLHPDRAEELFGSTAAPPAPGAYALFGLRELPVLGREPERQLLWNAVRAAAIDRRPSAVLLTGGTGSGKSRLARDAVERALELGLCHVMHTHWSDLHSADEGLRGLLENTFKSRASSAAELRSRVRFWLDRVRGQHESFEREVEIFLRPRHDAAPDAGLGIRVTVDAIRKAGQIRPVLLWLDDVQWSQGEAVQLLHALAKMTPRPPVCAIATYGEQEGGEEPAAVAAALRALCDQDEHRFSHARVAPLDRHTILSLVRGLLDLDERLQDLVAERAEGNPLYVTELLRHLVERGAMVRRGKRYSLADDSHLDDWLPADVEAIWERRVSSCGAELVQLSALALVRERASQALVDALTRELGPRFRDSTERALAAGLLNHDRGLYRWSDGMLRSYLLKAIPASHTQSLHRSAARALEALTRQEDVQEERAHHLHHAGDSQQACEALLEAAMLSWRRTERDARNRRLELLLSWLSAEPDTGWAQPLRARVAAERAQLAVERGDIQQANDNLELALSWFPREGRQYAADAAWVHFRHAQAVRLQGDAVEGARANLRAVACARVAGEQELQSLNHTQLALDAYRRGDLGDARTLFDQAAAEAQRCKNRATEAMVLLQSSSLEPIEAQERQQSIAIQMARDAGALRVELMARQMWIDALWQTGQRERARREAGVVSAEAERREMRQTVSIVELQAAYWAIQEDDFALADRHRTEACKWGALTGATVERAIAAALDLVIALAYDDETRTRHALQTVLSRGKGYEEQTFRYLIQRAATLSPTVGKSLTQLK